MGTKQLIGTIQQVETHREDHTDTGDPGAWTDLSTRFAELVGALRDHYRRASADGAPDEAEVGEALRTLGSAAEALLRSVGSALRDPGVRTRLEETASGFVSALGATFEELGQELEKIADRPPADP